MPPREHPLVVPTRMSRVAIVAPKTHLREALAVVADAGVVEFSGALPPADGEALEVLRRVSRTQAGDRLPEPALSPEPLDLAAAERDGAAALLAGEVELVRRAGATVEHGSFAAVVGWTPTDELQRLRERLTSGGAVAVELPKPPWIEPPTRIADTGVARPFRPLVETYGSARYADLDPTLFATASFVLMFGMMFGDVGHGLLLAAAGLLLRHARSGRLASVRRAWQFLFLGGLSAAGFGLVYGACLGPTGLVPTLWLDPIDEPTPLLAAAIVVGGILLANSYAIGIVNRWREEGASVALIAPSGVAGAAVFLGSAAAGGGWYADALPLAVAGSVVAGVGLVLLAVGFLLEAGRGPRAALEATISTFDAVVRVGTSVISFTRLAAFGLVHAALGAVVWDATTAAWGGVVGSTAAVLVFVLGNAIAFSLELLVTGIQALRLEYYELFSRIFAGDGHPFTPWHIPLAPGKETP